MVAAQTDDRLAGIQGPDVALTWWDRHKDLVSYPLTGIVVGVLGLLWNGTLSMILTPVWMLAGVWYIPTRVEHLLRRRR
jgi:hypothetical protein